MEHTNLNSFEESKQFYDNRHAKGYMDSWPAEKQNQVSELIRQLDLPSQGIALDFGCGKDVFTQVIKNSLPNWNIYGCDISRIAVEEAKKRFPDCDFFVIDDENEIIKSKSDFLFTHHILEHVLDLDQTFSIMTSYMSTKGTMLHILPCGNKNSLAHKICDSTTDGIDKTNGRFFYEDPCHIRRLTTDQIKSVIEKHTFTVIQDYYNFQKYDAIKEFASRSKEFIREFADPAKGINKKTSLFLFSVRHILLFVRLCYSTHARGIKTHIKECFVFSKKALVAMAKVIAFIPFKLVCRYISYRARREWIKYKHIPNGGQMFIVARRNENSGIKR